MDKTRCIQAGDAAADFVLKDHTNKAFTLSAHTGKRVLLSFHPLAWTSVCAQQMQSLEKNYEIFTQLNTVAVGISVDSVPSKNSWAKSLQIKNTPLLSDFWPHGKVAESFGVFRNNEGISERAHVIVNEEGVIEYVQIYELSELPDIAEIIAVLKTMEHIEA